MTMLKQCKSCECKYEYLFDNGFCAICNDNLIKGLPECYREPPPVYHVPCADEKRAIDRHFYDYIMTALANHKARTHGLNSELITQLKKDLETI